METEKPEHSGLVEKVSRNAGVCVGMTAALGKRIVQASAGGVAVMGGLLPSFGKRSGRARPRRIPPASEPPVGELEAEKVAPQKLPLVVQPAGAESNPAPVPLEQGEVSLISQEQRSQTSSRPIERQWDNEAPVSELKEAHFEADEAAAQKDALMSEVTVLRYELSKAHREAEEIRVQEEEARSGLASQLQALKGDNERLIVDLDGVRSALEESKTREEALRTLVTELESDLATARCKLQEAQNEADKLRSELADATAHELSIISAISEGGDAAPPDVDECRHVYLPVEEHGKPSKEAIATPRNKETEPACCRRESRRSGAMAETSDFPAVSSEEVNAAVFADSANRVIFKRARSDIASQSSNVRVSAARALGGVRHELSARILAAQAACEPSPEVRHECIKALTALHMREGLPAVKRALTDPAVSVRLAAVRGLYRLAGAEGASALTHMLSDSNEEVRRRATTCIGWLGQEEDARALLSLLADGSVSVRHAAIEALANLRSGSAVWPLIERLSDPEDSIRKAALRALETITGKKMSESAAADEDSHERVIARWRAWWRG